MNSKPKCKVCIFGSIKQMFHESEKKIKGEKNNKQPNVKEIHEPNWKSLGIFLVFYFANWVTSASPLSLSLCLSRCRSSILSYLRICLHQIYRSLSGLFAQNDRMPQSPKSHHFKCVRVRKSKTKEKNCCRKIQFVNVIYSRPFKLYNDREFWAIQWFRRLGQAQKIQKYERNEEKNYQRIRWRGKKKNNCSRTICTSISI